MKRVAAIHIYDMLDQVVIAARVRAYSSYEGDSESELEVVKAVSFPSSGEEWGSRWLRDALLELAETL